MHWHFEMQFYDIMVLYVALTYHTTLDSSVGRAEDCSWNMWQISLGHWFESSSREFFIPIWTHYSYDLMCDNKKRRWSSNNQLLPFYGSNRFHSFSWLNWLVSPGISNKRLAAFALLQVVPYFLIIC